MGALSSISIGGGHQPITLTNSIKYRLSKIQSILREELVWYQAWVNSYDSSSNQFDGGSRNTSAVHPEIRPERIPKKVF